MSVIDVGGEVREGEELDIGAVENWLKNQGVELVGPAVVTQYTGGASNWTYRLKYENTDLILRRPPKGTKAKSAHDMAREYMVQKNLAPYYPVLPKMVALCQDESVIGCDFYVMERIEGIIPRAKLPPELGFNEDDVHELCVNVIDKLIELHQVPYENTPLADCIIHNDWRFDNVILDPEHPTEVIGVLDWEMATLGDPLMDLGSALAYWVEPTDNMIFRSTRRQPTHLKGMFSRKEVVDYYLQKTGLEPQNWTFYEVFGVFRLAVIAQQIYYRYYHKQTRNPAFKDFWIVIHALHIRALKLIAQQKLQESEFAQQSLQKIQGILRR
ncbi:TPA: phosphotransferase family protein [Acinetobacter baumannii]|nr:phosphotransferase family protein [Acinetobacter baumannii]